MGRSDYRTFAKWDSQKITQYALIHSIVYTLACRNFDQHKHIMLGKLIELLLPNSMIQLRRLNDARIYSLLIQFIKDCSFKV